MHHRYSVTPIRAMASGPSRSTGSGVPSVLLSRAHGPSRRRDCHLLAPPCTFIRGFNTTIGINRGVSVK